MLVQSHLFTLYAMTAVCRSYGCFLGNVSYFSMHVSHVVSVMHTENDSCILVIYETNEVYKVRRATTLVGHIQGRKRCKEFLIC